MEKQVNETEFYSKGKQYWKNVDATVDGMLGGFADISDIDIQYSQRFLRPDFVPLDTLDKSNEQDAEVSKRQQRALDCGAGIGRITKNLLLKYFAHVDLLEQNDNFLKEARNHIGENIYDKRVTSICSSLHTFDPVTDVKYDLIWCQWVTGHLTDDHFVDFLNKCKSILNKPHGLIVIKDNHTTFDEIDADMNDSSITRPYSLFLKIFKKCNLKLIREKRQYKFPKGIYPVKMFALSPFSVEN